MKSLKNHYMKISAGGKFYLTMIVDVFRTSRTSNPEIPIIAGSQKENFQTILFIIFWNSTMF